MHELMKDLFRLDPEGIILSIKDALSGDLTMDQLGELCALLLEAFRMNLPLMARARVANLLRETKRRRRQVGNSLGVSVNV